MKIGYFITHYPYDNEYGDYFCGGTGAVAINLAKEMVKKGHDVSVFTTSRTKKFAEFRPVLRRGPHSEKGHP